MIKLGLDFSVVVDDGESRSWYELVDLISFCLKEIKAV